MFLFGSGTFHFSALYAHGAPSTNYGIKRCCLIKPESSTRPHLQEADSGNLQLAVALSEGVAAHSARYPS